MKEQYEIPRMEIVFFDCEDIVTTSISIPLSLLNGSNDLPVAGP